MQFLSALANIAQILSFIWVLIFGSKTIFEVGKAGRKFNLKLHPVLILNLLVALIVLFISFILLQRLGLSGLSILNSNSKSTGTPYTLSGTPAYAADWSKGLNDWAVNPGGGLVTWSTTKNGQLIAGGPVGNDFSSIMPPYQPESLNYAVEVEARFLSSSGNTDFEICVRDNGRTGFCYSMSINGDGSGQIGLISLADLTSTEIPTMSYHPGLDWHTYIVEANYNQINLFVDGEELEQNQDATYLTPDPYSNGTYSGSRIQLGATTQIGFRIFKVFELT